jgi:hypothetical protein
MGSAHVVFIVATDAGNNKRNVAVIVTVPPPNGTLGYPTLLNSTVVLFRGTAAKVTPLPSLADMPFKSESNAPVYSTFKLVNPPVHGPQLTKGGQLHPCP